MDVPIFPIFVAQLEIFATEILFLLLQIENTIYDIFCFFREPCKFFICHREVFPHMTYFF